MKNLEACHLLAACSGCLFRFLGSCIWLPPMRKMWTFNKDTGHTAPLSTSGVSISWQRIAAVTCGTLAWVNLRRDVGDFVYTGATFCWKQHSEQLPRWSTSDRLDWGAHAWLLGPALLHAHICQLNGDLALRLRCWIASIEVRTPAQLQRRSAQRKSRSFNHPSLPPGRL